MNDQLYGRGMRPLVRIIKIGAETTIYVTQVVTRTNRHNLGSQGMLGSLSAGNDPSIKGSWLEEESNSLKPKLSIMVTYTLEE
jgi:hypothetical protein